MGYMVRPVCHDCKERLQIGAWKLTEVILNQPVAADVGRWLLNHLGHDVEMQKDTEWSEARPSA